MIEVYDTVEEEYVIINLSKIIIVYPSLDKKNAVIKVDGLEYPIETSDTYEEVRKILNGVNYINVR